jgi:hypothetical protein
MGEKQFSAFVDFLIRLRAENLAMRRYLEQTGQVGPAWMDRLIEDQFHRIRDLPEVATVLQDQSHLEGLLGKMAALRWQ